MVSYKVSVRCKDSAVLGVEQRSRKGSTEVKNLINFDLFLPSFDLVCLNQGGGGGDLLQRQGDDQQQGGADSDPTERNWSPCLVGGGGGHGVEEGRWQAQEGPQLLHQQRHQGREGDFLAVLGFLTKLSYL